MVSKCSLVGCRSRYMKKKVKMHRFPLTNLNILPSWIAFMRKEAHWKPKRSSRLCSNHFIESDYKFKHGKGVLNPTSVPSIEYRVKVPQFKRRNVQLHPSLNKRFNQTKNVNKINNENVVQERETSYNLALYQGYWHVKVKKNQKPIENIKYYGSSNFDDNEYQKENENSDNETMEYKSEFNSCHQNKNDVCNRKNQCYLLTKSFIANLEPRMSTHPAFKEFEQIPSSRNNSTFISNYTESMDSNILKSPTENQNRLFVDIEKQKRDLIFNNIMKLILNKQRCTKDIYSLYFNSPKIRSTFSPEQGINFLNDDMATMKQFHIGYN